MAGARSDTRDSVSAVFEPHVVTVDPAAAGFDLTALDAFRAKVAQQVDEGRMPSGQYAFAIDGQLAVFEAYGDATT